MQIILLLTVFVLTACAPPLIVRDANGNVIDVIVNPQAERYPQPERSAQAPRYPQALTSISLEKERRWIDHYKAYLRGQAAPMPMRQGMALPTAAQSVAYRVSRASAT